MREEMRAESAAHGEARRVETREREALLAVQSEQAQAQAPTAAPPSVQPLEPAEPEMSEGIPQTAAATVTTAKLSTETGGVRALPPPVTAAPLPLPPVAAADLELTTAGSLVTSSATTPVDFEAELAAHSEVTHSVELISCAFGIRAHGSGIACWCVGSHLGQQVT